MLSKSSYIRGLQCEKSLYLYKKHYNLKDPVPAERQALFNKGSRIGILAQGLFPGGIDASPTSHMRYSEGVKKTAELIASGCETIYEAGFNSNDVVVLVDILHKKDGKWYAYEVKSSVRISQVYVHDACLQYNIIKGAGLDLEDMFLVHIDSSYIRRGELEIQKMFSFYSIKNEAEKASGGIALNIERLRGMLERNSLPEKEPGEHCFSPYQCDFLNYCWQSRVPRDSVFSLTGLSKTEQFGLYNSGYRSILDVPLEKARELGIQKLTESFIHNRVEVDHTAVNAFLDQLNYPLMFLDFESYMPVIPPYENSSPYDHIPFQFSLHVMEGPDSEPLHYSFLAEEKCDPRRDFLISLLELAKGEGSILVYNETFEKTVLRKLIVKYPEVSEEGEKIISRIIDLMEPFKKGHYYHPEMKGSYSIKSVLPALVPDMSYENLKLSNGTLAMAAYDQLQYETDLFTIAEIKEQLLEYCKLDTLAMVKLLKVLQDSSLRKQDGSRLPQE